MKKLFGLILLALFIACDDPVGPGNGNGGNTIFSPPLTDTYNPAMRPIYAAAAEAIIRQPKGFWKDTIPYDSLNFYTYPVDLLHFKLSDTTLTDTGVTSNGTRFVTRDDYLFNSKDSSLTEYYFSLNNTGSGSIYRCTDTTVMKMKYSTTSGYLHAKGTRDYDLWWPNMLDDSTMLTFAIDDYLLMQINVQVLRVCRK